MTKVLIDMSMSLDGLIARRCDGRQLPLGGRGAGHIFDWYFSGAESYEGTMFTPVALTDRWWSSSLDSAHATHLRFEVLRQ
jgi:hypothetical protein